MGGQLISPWRSRDFPPGEHEFSPFRAVSLTVFGGVVRLADLDGGIKAEGPACEEQRGDHGDPEGVRPDRQPAWRGRGRQTRITELVNDLDPKLTAVALGMNDTGLARPPVLCTIHA